MRRQHYFPYIFYLFECIRYRLYIIFFPAAYDVWFRNVLIMPDPYSFGVRLPEQVHQLLEQRILLALWYAIKDQTCGVVPFQIGIIKLSKFFFREFREQFIKKRF